MSDKLIKNRVKSLEYINWRELQFIQQEQFKELAPDEKHALKASLVSNNFSDPFKVWQCEADGVTYCLDGKHRSLMLNELLSEGYDVPYQLPAVFFECDNKQDAAKLVLIFSSYYAKIRQGGMSDFMEMYQLDWAELKQSISLPDFSMDRFEQKFDIFGVGQSSEEDEHNPNLSEDLPLVVKPGDVFKLGKHTLCCLSFRDELVQAHLLANGQEARIVFTDPPYNLKASTFTNGGIAKHKDFAEGGGEMSETEFAGFIEVIMQKSCQWSADGAIHFICMDWRHVWHMTHAATKVYGSPIPKQLIVWKKDFPTNGSFYRSQHELVFVFKNGEAKHVSKLEFEDRFRSNVWEYPSGHSIANEDRDLVRKHPTPKPVAMVADAILDTTNEGDLVIDWFMGSGTTLIAAEKTHRVSFGTEIEPQYVQNIIIRWIDFCKRNSKPCEFEHLNGSLTLTDFAYEKTSASNAKP